LNIAEASLAEVEAALELCLDLKLITEKEYLLTESKRLETGI